MIFIYFEVESSVGLFFSLGVVMVVVVGTGGINIYIYTLNAETLTFCADGVISQNCTFIIVCDSYRLCGDKTAYAT